jgi:hypothetical protein
MPFTAPSLIPESVTGFDGEGRITFAFDQAITGLSATDIIVVADGVSLNPKSSAYVVDAPDPSTVRITLQGGLTVDRGEDWRLSMPAGAVFSAEGGLGNLPFSDVPVLIALRSRSRDRSRDR